MKQDQKRYLSVSFLKIRPFKNLKTQNVAKGQKAQLSPQRKLGAPQLSPQVWPSLVLFLRTKVNLRPNKSNETFLQEELVCHEKFWSEGN